MLFITILLPLAIQSYGQTVDIQLPIDSTVLNRIPSLGFGTWNLDRSNATEAVSFAIRTGYRHIDGAAAYDNEDLVGKGIEDGLQKTGLSREDIWVTSKLWNDHHDPDKVEAAIDKTLSKLGLSYLDLYHMHWPVASTKSGNRISYLSTWDAMVSLVRKGKTRHIGISNFAPAQLDTLLNHTWHRPLVHQFETHPYLQQTKWLSYHAARGIHVTAYSPLAGTNPTYQPGEPPQLLRNKEVEKIAERRGCSTAQVALAWGLKRGTSVIPKSSHKERIEENFQSVRCRLEDEDFEVIDELGNKFTHRYNNPSKSWGVDLYEGLEGV